jgi:hypothetical protein
MVQPERKVEMQEIKRNAIFSGLVLIIDLGVCCYLAAKESYNLLYLPAMLIPIVAVYFYRWLQKVKSAELITENVLLSIPAGKVWRSDDKAAFFKSNKVEPVILSGFGVLAGENVYKFNCDGIRLLSMKIDPETIFLTYGTPKKQDHIMLRHGLIKKEDIQDIADKIHYETGIVPEVQDWQTYCLVAISETTDSSP